MAVRPVQSLSACTRVHFTVLAFIQINVSLVPILLVLLLLCISSTNARIMEHTKWVCLRPTVRMLLSSTKESDKWWLYRNSATPTNAQFYSLCMISLVHVLSLSPSSQSLHQNVIKTYILFFFVVWNFGVSSLKVTKTPKHVSLVIEWIYRLCNCAFIGVVRVLIYHNARNEQCIRTFVIFGMGNRPLF